jgi:hypothetical protein
MATFSSTQPSLKARILPRFPAQVLAGTGITITKSGGTYVFAVQAYADIPITALASIPSDRLLGRDTNGIGPVEILTASGGIGFNGVGSLELTQNQRIRAIPLVLLTAAAAQDILVPFACTITRVTVLGNTTASTATVTIWKNTYANWPPTIANDITGGVPPVTSAGKYQNSTLAGWNVNIAASDILRLGLTGMTAASVIIDTVTL